MKNLGKKIKQLRNEGKTYTEIQRELNCSRSIVSYHCGKNQKEKTKQKNKSYRNTTKYLIYKKIDNYFGRNLDESSVSYEYVKRTDKHHILYENILKNPYCYITGKKINLDDTKSWSIDHINPISSGGQNTIENAGLCLSIINAMKTDLSLEDFKFWCKIVVDSAE